MILFRRNWCGHLRITYQMPLRPISKTETCQVELHSPTLQARLLGTAPLSMTLLALRGIPALINNPLWVCSITLLASGQTEVQTRLDRVNCPIRCSQLVRATKMICKFRFRPQRQLLSKNQMIWQSSWGSLPTTVSTALTILPCTRSLHQKSHPISSTTATIWAHQKRGIPLMPLATTMAPWEDYWTSSAILIVLVRNMTIHQYRLGSAYEPGSSLEMPKKYIFAYTEEAVTM